MYVHNYIGWVSDLKTRQYKVTIQSYLEMNTESVCKVGTFCAQKSSSHHISYWPFMFKLALVEHGCYIYIKITDPNAITQLTEYCLDNNEALYKFNSITFLSIPAPSVYIQLLMGLETITEVWKLKAWPTYPVL